MKQLIVLTDILQILEFCHVKVGSTCQLDGEKIIRRHLPKGYPVVEVNENNT